MTTADYIGFVVIALMIAGGLWGRSNEKKLWNRGFCPECLTIWQGFDMDSQGGRGYRCECKPRRRIWISWGVDQ